MSKRTKLSSEAKPATCTCKTRRRITGTGGKDKTPVMGILERGGKDGNARSDDRNSKSKKSAIQSEVRKHVEAGSALYSDALQSYKGLEGEYAHQVIDQLWPMLTGKCIRMA